MKLGLISDVHGNRAALAAVLAALKHEVDLIVFLGDLCGYYPFVNECANLLDQQEFLGVRGNHDQVLLECLTQAKTPAQNYQARYGSALQRSLNGLSNQARALIESWPLEREMTLASQSILMMHGAPWDPLEGRIYPDFSEWNRLDAYPADVILLGHTHYSLAKRHGATLLVNPGSVGQARDGSGGACYAVLELPSGVVSQHAVPYDTSSVIRDAREHDPQLPYLEMVLSR